MPIQVGRICPAANLEWSLQATGVEFPAVTHFWEGEAFRSLGAGVRQKKIAFVGVKVRLLSTSILMRRAQLQHPNAALQCACGGDKHLCFCVAL